MELLLDRVGSCNENEWIHLKCPSQIKFGRGMLNDVRLLSVYVSRSQARIVVKQDRSVEITDLNSAHGVIVNGHKILPGVPCLLNVGDRIEMGISPDVKETGGMNKSDMFIYALKSLDQESIASRPHPANVHDTVTAKQVGAGKHKLGIENFATMKRSKLSADANNNASDGDREVEVKEMKEEITKIVKEKKELESVLQVKQTEYEQQLLDKSIIHHQKEDELKLKIDAMQKKMEGMEKSIIEKEEMLNEQLVKADEILEKEEFVRTKEEMLNEQLKIAKEITAKEETLSNALREKEENLKTKENELEQKMQSKDIEVEQKLESATASAIDDIVCSLEPELQCPICNEMYIDAYTISCSHTFCKFCISCWYKNNSTCPSCRETIFTATRSLTINNTIESIVSKMSLDVQRERQLTVHDRSQNYSDVSRFRNITERALQPDAIIDLTSTPELPTSNLIRQGTRERSQEARRGTRERSQEARRGTSERFRGAESRRNRPQTTTETNHPVVRPPWRY